MSRLSNAVPKYRATGQAVVTIAGKDNYLGPHGTKASQILYDRLIAEYLAAGLDHRLSRLNPPRPTSEIGSMKLIIRDWKAEFSLLPASQFGPMAIKRFRRPKDCQM